MARNYSLTWDPAAKKSLTVDFSTFSETPLSRGGLWSSNGTDRTRVAVSGGRAYGTQTSTSQPPYDDSYAYYNSGVWSPDVEITSVIYKGAPAGIREIEHNFRITDTPGSNIVKLYEINLAHDGQYCNFGGWSGDASNPANFFGLAPDGGSGIQFSVPGGVHDGDLFRTTIVGNAMNAYINYNDGNGWHLINTSGPVLDTAGSGGGARYTSGYHGLGFYDERQNGSGSANSEFGIRSITIREL